MSTRQRATHVPPALLENTAKLAARAQARLAAEGRVLISFIQERKAEIAAAFYDIGEALVKLKKPGIAQARGHASFYAMCDADLGLKATQVDELVDIATHLTRKDAIALGQSKAGAFARLAEATPAVDTPAGLARRGVRTPSGKSVTKKSSARAIDEASKEFRRIAKGKKRGRGRTTTADEQAIATAIQNALHRAGVKTAKVRAVASQPGKEANLRIEGIPMSARPKLAAALRAK